MTCILTGDWTIDPGVLSILISISSLFVSFRSYNRDYGRLRLNLSIGTITNLQNNLRGTEALFITVRNIGRRPVTITSLEFRKNFFFLFRALSYARLIKPPESNFLAFNSPNNLVLENGKFRVLAEGEVYQQTIPLANLNTDNLKKILNATPRACVEDSTGKLFYASRSDISSVLNGLNRYIAPSGA